MKRITLWTIGHSNRHFSELVAMLVSHQIQVLVDVRSFPGSRANPQFHKEYIAKYLPRKIGYVWIEDLGGRRRVNPDSHNTAWRNASFRGYADHMETLTFRQGIDRLLELAKHNRVAYMCSEGVWWRCHRSMISDYLKSNGHTVIHIMAEDCKRDAVHPYTSPAKIVNGKLSYRGEL